MNVWGRILSVLAVLAVLSAAAGGARAQSAEGRIVWAAGTQQLEVRLVDVAVPAGMKDLSFEVAVFDGEAKRVLSARPRIVFAKDKPPAVSVELKNLGKAGTAYRVEVSIDEDALKLHYFEEIAFARPDQAVMSCGIRRLGLFGGQKVHAVLWLQGVAAADARKAQVGLVVRDADENVVLEKIEKVDLAAEPTRHVLDVTPTAEAVGPCTLELKVENPAVSWAFETSRRFAFANALVPVSSFEIDDRTWSTIREASDELPNEPLASYDGAVHRGGRQSLKIDYLPQGEQVVYGFQALPGLPTMLHLWVKGNGSDDLLYVTFHDHYETTRAHWLRFANTSRELVCTLKFEGWREFRVPVLGGGLQKVSPAGSSEAIDAPIYAASLEVHGRWGKTKEQPDMPRRTVWIDDLAVETQARADRQLSMELRADTPDRLGHKDARLFVAIGNGSGKAVEGGKLRVAAKDRDGQAVFQAAQDVSIPAGEFTAVEVPMAAAFEKRPPGPVDVDVQFAVPGSPGLRAGGRIAFKSALNYGLVWDFENPETYNALGFDRNGLKVLAATGGQCVPGGAEGSARALRVPFGPTDPNSVLLHPALPGMVDRIELLVRAQGGPVVLRPVLMDSGLTGHTNKDFNRFYLPEIKVDWQDWRKVELVAPPVPPQHGDKNVFFMNQPYYPLNLGFLIRRERAGDGKPAGGGSAEVFLDNIRVRTHLAPQQELQGEVVFADDSRLHAPGSPLEVALTNFAAADRKVPLAWRLESFQGRSAGGGQIELTVPAGGKVVHKLTPSVPAGMYTLTIEGLAAQPVRQCIQAVDTRRYFGERPLETLTKMPELRKSLGMTDVRVYLDWDNVEGVPGLHHFEWFNLAVKEATADGAYSATPVVGFAADWAAPHQQSAIAKGEYHRFIPDRLQVPVRLVDWDRFVRVCLREWHGRFARWEFWENADLSASPQGIPPPLYGRMLSVFSKWVSLYDPKARIVAGGFNMDRVLDYLERVEHAADLPFHELSIQMSMGDLSPESADVEGLLDELNEALQASRTGKRVQLREMDWPIGGYVTPAQQAAWHARALLILHSRGAPPHQFGFTNTGQQFDGPGIFYRMPYGNSECVQTLKSVYAPKPAYFAHRHVRDFLAQWQFVEPVTIHDSDPQANRAMLYRSATGRLAAVVWRTVEPARLYRLPPAWKDARAVDTFGFDVPLGAGLLCAGGPTFLFLPDGATLAQVRQELRLLAGADGKDRVLLALHLAEPESCKAAQYTATGGAARKDKYGQVPGGRKAGRTFVEGLTAEEFQFTMPEAGRALLSRLWLLDGDGRKLTVRLNGGAGQTWDLTRSKLGATDTGPRESTFVLAACRAGANTVQIAYDGPGNCASYRVEPLAGEAIDLCRWGILHALQTKGTIQKFRSAAGTPLAIGKTRYATGLGTHAASLTEYPIDGQFAAFEATVGIDASTDGRGSAVFEVLVDGVSKASSKVLNGFSKPETLRVEGLEGARRLVLLVKDAGDGNQDDLADWVDARLLLKK